MKEQEKMVIEVLNTLTPAMEADGGGIKLVSIEGDTIYVCFVGACLVCPSISLTMKFGVIKTLQEKLPWVKDVVNVSKK